METVFSVMVRLSSGIPALLISGAAIILTLLALIRKSPGLMILAAALILPLAIARGSWTGIGLLARSLPAFSLGSAFAISRDDAIFPWALAAPVFGYLAYLIFKIVAAGYTGIEPIYIY
ncbi:MAG: hypothetical protein LDL51_07230 [Chloroflexi bacterium]|nr:hypothetical protein [Chloroflexota bacterium]